MVDTRTHSLVKNRSSLHSKLLKGPNILKVLADFTAYQFIAKKKLNWEVEETREKFFNHSPRSLSYKFDFCSVNNTLSEFSLMQVDREFLLK